MLHVIKYFPFFLAFPSVILAGYGQPLNLLATIVCLTLYSSFLLYQDQTIPNASKELADKMAILEAKVATLHEIEARTKEAIDQLDEIQDKMNKISLNQGFKR